MIQGIKEDSPYDDPNYDDGDPGNWNIPPGGWYYPSGMPGVGGRYWQVNPYSYEGGDYGGGGSSNPTPPDFPGPAWQGRKGEKYQQWWEYADPSDFDTVEPVPGDEDNSPLFPNSPLLPEPTIPNLFDRPI